MIMATTMHCVLLLVIKISVGTHWHKKNDGGNLSQVGVKG